MKKLLLCIFLPCITQEVIYTTQLLDLPCELREKILQHYVDSMPTEPTLAATQVKFLTHASLLVRNNTPSSLFKIFRRRLDILFTNHQQIDVLLPEISAWSDNKLLTHTAATLQAGIKQELVSKKSNKEYMSADSATLDFINQIPQTRTFAQVQQFCDYLVANNFFNYNEEVDKEQENPAIRIKWRIESLSYDSWGGYSRQRIQQIVRLFGFYAINFPYRHCFFNCLNFNLVDRCRYFAQFFNAQEVDEWELYQSCTNRFISGDLSNEMILEQREKGLAKIQYVLEEICPTLIKLGWDTDHEMNLYILSDYIRRCLHDTQIHFLNAAVIRYLLLKGANLRIKYSCAIPAIGQRPAQQIPPTTALEFIHKAQQDFAQSTDVSVHRALATDVKEARQYLEIAESCWSQILPPTQLEPNDEEREQIKQLIAQQFNALDAASAG